LTDHSSVMGFIQHGHHSEGALWIFMGCWTRDEYWCRWQVCMGCIYIGMPLFNWLKHSDCDC
jgi:hypothetical protein